MSVDYQAAMDELGEEYKRLNGRNGGAMKAFGGLHAATMKDGALSGKVKELLALAISVNLRCEGCIVSHARSAVKAGATPEELAEAVGVSIMMGGGPATVYGAKALDAAEAFSAS